MQRKDRRLPLEMRPLEFILNYTEYAEGSCLAKMGKTTVLCTASIEDKIPPFLRNTGKGWIHAEYSLLPRATHTRNQRDVIKGYVNGRAQEIQRLIGRVLRTTVNLAALGERQIIIDCDVLQADGGTRVTAINGGYVALCLALRSLQARGALRTSPLVRKISAVSCAIIDGVAILDPCFEEDSRADADSTFVFTSSLDDRAAGWAEIQSSAEGAVFSDNQLQQLMEVSATACRTIMTQQQIALTT